MTRWKPLARAGVPFAGGKRLGGQANRRERVRCTDYTNLRAAFREIETALELGLPIVEANLNGKRRHDPERCPPIMQDDLFELRTHRNRFVPWVKRVGVCLIFVRYDHLKLFAVLDALSRLTQS